MSCALLSLLLLLARPCHVAAAVQSGSRQSCYPICSGCTTFFPLFFLSSLRKKKKEDSCTWSWSEKSGPVGRDDSARFWPVLGRSKLLAPFRLLPFISLSSSSSSTLALPSSPSSDGQVPLRSPSLVRWWPCLWLPFDRLPFTTVDWNRYWLRSSKVSAKFKPEYVPDWRVESQSSSKLLTAVGAGLTVSVILAILFPAVVII